MTDDATRLAAPSALSDLTKSIEMQDVRLAVGEGELSNAAVLAGVNAVLGVRERRAAALITALPWPRIEFHQHDWLPGFAAFCSDGEIDPSSTAFCILNLGSMLATIQTGDVPASDLPYFVAESMMHEIMHVLERWAKVEFSEERVEALLEAYRVKYGQVETPPAAALERPEVERGGGEHAP